MNPYTYQVPGTEHNAKEMSDGHRTQTGTISDESQSLIHLPEKTP